MTLLLLLSQVDAASSHLNDRLVPRERELAGGGAGSQELEELR